MTLQVMGTSVSLTLTLTNSVAVQNSDPAYCGSYTASYSPTKTFLAVSGLTLTGQSLSLGDIGTYSITVIVDLPQYARKSTTFTLTVTCTPVAPTVAVSTVTLEIGVDTQPFSIDFTQSLSCGVSATLSSTPTSPTWLSLNGINSSGGKVLINGATLASVGTYALSLTNTYSS